MPFTPAHVAAVLPFARRPWIFPALVAGSMAPDMPYFVRTLPVAVTAESWYEPLLNASTSHSVANRRRLLRSSGLGSRFVWLMASALVGIATHLVWDAATHSMRVLQHLSTSTGLLILVVVLVVLVRQRSQLGRLRISAVAPVLLFGGISASAGAWLQHRNDSTSSAEHLLRAGAEAAGFAVGAALAVAVAGWWLRQGFSPRASDRAHNPKVRIPPPPSPETAPQRPFPANRRRPGGGSTGS